MKKFWAISGVTAIIALCFSSFAYAGYVSQNQAGIRKIDYGRSSNGHRPTENRQTKNVSPIQLAREYEQQGFMREAINWYQKAAEEGDVDAMYALGYIYEEGKRVPQNYEESLKWYEKAAAAGSVEGMNNAGAMYVYGRGTEKNYTKAVEYFKKAIEANPKAIGPCVNLGLMFEMGWGVTRNYDAAIYWFGRGDFEAGKDIMRVRLLMLHGECPGNSYPRSIRTYTR